MADDEPYRGPHPRPGAAHPYPPPVSIDYLVIQSFPQWARDKIGISDDFIEKLDSDNDWTLVIKLHAMIEAGLNHLILEKLGDPRLDEIVSRMDTGDRELGKLAFIKTLDLLSSECRSFIKVLSSLRNNLVHDVQQLGFTFKKWVSSLDKSKLREVHKSILSLIPETVAAGEGKFISSTEVVEKNMRLAIEVASFNLMILVLKSEIGLAGDLPDP